jgi:CDP-4-dehydro-6-deoxyglucose reductase, E1
MTNSELDKNLHIGAPFSGKEKPGHIERIVQYSGAYYGQAEIDAVNRVLENGWLGAGPENRALEQELSVYMGSKYAHTCNSGSSANLLALSSLDLPEGSKVVVPACSFPTTVNPIIQRGLIPLFVETDIETLNPNLEQLCEAMSNPGVSAVMIAHTLGNPNPMDIIMAEAKHNGVKVIEDNCDAVGSIYKDKPTGTFGSVSTVSFYPAHHATALGGGGAVLTDSGYISKKIKMFRDWGRGCWCADSWEAPCTDRFGFKLLDGTEWDHRYFWQEIGYNLSMVDAQAAFARVQIQRLPDFVVKRQQNFATLYAHFAANYQDLFVLPKVVEGAEPSWFGFPITIRDGVGLNRNKLQRDLEKYGVQTRTHFAGNVLSHPAYKGVKHEKIGDSFPNSDKIARDTLFFGVWPGIGKEDMDYMINVFDKILKESR